MQAARRCGERLHLGGFGATHAGWVIFISGARNDSGSVSEAVTEDEVTLARHGAPLPLTPRHAVRSRAQTSHRRRSSLFTTGRVRALRATSVKPAFTKVEKAPV